MRHSLAEVLLNLSDEDRRGWMTMVCEPRVRRDPYNTA